MTIDIIPYMVTAKVFCIGTDGKELVFQIEATDEDAQFKNLWKKILSVYGKQTRERKEEAVDNEYRKMGDKFVDLGSGILLEFCKSLCEVGVDESLIKEGLLKYKESRKNKDK